MKKLLFLLATILIFGCSASDIDYKAGVITIDSYEPDGTALRGRPYKVSPLLLKATNTTGTLEEQLASMVHDFTRNANTITWNVEPDRGFHVVIKDEQGYWLLQTSTSGNNGFYIKNYITNRKNDPNGGILKGATHYLFFSQHEVTVPFVFN